MLTEAELNSPAQLQYGRADADAAEHPISWNNARAFTSLCEALHVTMTEEAPPGQVAYIRAESGHILRPEVLEQLWSSLQGP
jgi:hypothetical protein